MREKRPKPTSFRVVPGGGGIDVASILWILAGASGFAVFLLMVMK